MTIKKLSFFKVALKASDQSLLGGHLECKRSVSLDLSVCFCDVFEGKSEKCLVETAEVGYTSWRYRQTRVFGHTAIPVGNLLYSNARTL